jgi:hypothetical protein
MLPQHSIGGGILYIQELPFSSLCRYVHMLYHVNSTPESCQLWA